MDAIRILVVDDEPNVCAYLRELLQYYGFQVDCAQSCEAALHKLGERRYDAVMLDAWLSEADQDGLLRWKREEQRPEAIVLMSEWADFDMWIDYVNKGAADLIAKPCPPSQLVEVVRKAVRDKAPRVAEPAAVRRGNYSMTPYFRNE